MGDGTLPHEVRKVSTDVEKKICVIYFKKDLPPFKLYGE